MNLAPLMKVLKEHPRDPQECARLLVAEVPKGSTEADFVLFFRTAFALGRLPLEGGGLLLRALDSLRQTPDAPGPQDAVEDAALADLEAQCQQLRAECDEVRQLRQQVEQLKKERPSRERHRNDMRARRDALCQLRDEKRELLREVEHGNRKPNAI